MPQTNLPSTTLHFDISNRFSCDARPSLVRGFLQVASLGGRGGGLRWKFQQISSLKYLKTFFLYDIPTDSA